jgi:GNAT superfamily N-acetyltransferase
VPDVTELLAAYDAQLRDRVPDPLPVGVTVERDGPLLRFLGLGSRGFVTYRDLAGLEGTDVDELIARQVEVFAQRGERFEWKLHGHDRPDDLSQRLRAAGFVPEEMETVVIATAAEIAEEVQLPEGVSLRELTSRADLLRVAALEEAVWGDSDQESWLVDMLESERAVDPPALTILVAEAGATVVCAAWVRFEGDTQFATFWGGATLPEWRGRGIYRATVAYRARLAAARGFRYLEIDASAESRPILERLGFIAVTTTTPYVWSPPT